MLIISKLILALENASKVAKLVIHGGLIMKKILSIITLTKSITFITSITSIKLSKPSKLVTSIIFSKPITSAMFAIIFMLTTSTSLLASVEFINAAKTGDSKTVVEMLDKRVNMNLKDEDGYTALSHAASNGHTDIVRLLIAEKADVNTKNNSYKDYSNAGSREYYSYCTETPLMLAAKNGHVEIVRMLIDAGANVNARNTYNATALMYAVQKSNFEIVRLLVQAQADVNAKTLNNSSRETESNEYGIIENGYNGAYYGESVLMKACRVGNLQIVEFLVDSKANVKDVDARGSTTLIMASYHGHTELVKYLISKRVQINAHNIKSGSGATALMFAAEKGYTEVVALLLNAKANVNIEGPYRYTALLLAVWDGHTEIARLLIKSKANVNAMSDSYNYKDYTALMRASEKGYNEIASLLIDAKANTDFIDNEGYTALRLAIENDNRDIAQMLRNAKK